uniref:Retrotransposon gag domain-containing protein n=1 Tax=Anopheles stephensi TaxID=30069 RepID=A0A182YSV8_ANOST
MAGPSLYSIANRICSPEDPCSNTYKNQIELLKQHLAPKDNIIAERCKYHKCEQAANQTITEFIIELKSLSQSCDFGTFLSQATRSIRRRIAKLRVANQAPSRRSWEASEQECREMQGSSKLAAFKQRTSWKSSDRTPQGIEIINAFVVVEIIAPRACPAKQWKCYANYEPKREDHQLDRSSRCQQYEYIADGCTRNDGSGD